jgi:predicted O-linked N-acetylglucosamine transferase (SPINDLY family)
MNNKKILDVKKLFIKKNFEETILLIENVFTDAEKTPEILNILGVAKLQKKNSNSFDMLSAIENFRTCYLMEKRTKQGIEGLANFIVCSNKVHQYEDSIKYFKEAEKSFGYIRRLFSLIVETYKDLHNLESTIYYLKKIIEKEGLSNSNLHLQQYIFINSYMDKWSQKDFFENSIKLEEALPQHLERTVSIKKNKKIKLAFLSSDIRNNHSITGFLKTVVANVNKNKFELILFSNCKINKEDKTSKDFQKFFDEWININSLNDIEAINEIRKYNIDIIIDLMGLSSSNRIVLFKNRLAPIQILWLGYNNTSGLKEMDYLMVDPNLIEKNEAKFYSEKLLFLPSIWNCHSGFISPRKETHPPFIKNKYITFGSFNNINKISDDVIDVWSKILKKTNNSRLILKSSQTLAYENLKQKFKKKRVLDLITFLDRKNNFEDHIEEYKKIDVALDTFPYNGVTTSFEAIWMGIPLLTIKGFNPNSRAGVSINKNINMDYFIANNKDQYISKAIELSNNSKKIIEARKHLFENALVSNLFNVKKFSKEFFATLENINSIHTA